MAQEAEIMRVLGRLEGTTEALRQTVDAHRAESKTSFIKVHERLDTQAGEIAEATRDRAEGKGANKQRQRTTGLWVTLSSGSMGGAVVAGLVWAWGKLHGS